MQVLGSDRISLFAADLVQMAAIVDSLQGAFARRPERLAHLEPHLVVAWVCLFLTLYLARRLVRVCPLGMYLV